MSVQQYIENSYRVSRLVTNRYSTSFSLATFFLEKDKKKAIYAIYGFVRLADEIVDSFHGFNKAILLDNLNRELEYALKEGISSNSLLMAFADTVTKYNIDRKHIYAFMESMKYDLTKSNYSNPDELKEYIYGSADVVGLMCLTVFCEGKPALYEKLELPAQRLGSAFQKVNFLRDLKEDMQGLGRSYFPEISGHVFDAKSKRLIEHSIEKDFKEAWLGIPLLPGRSKLAVALAYYYYLGLFRKIKRSSPEKVLSRRVRISNLKKYLIIVKTSIRYKAKLV